MMFLIAVIAGLASIYCLTIASFAWEDIAFGLAIATALVAIYRRTLLPPNLPEAGRVIHMTVYMPVLIWMLLVDILKGTWQVATYVIGFEKLDHPGIVKIPLGEHGRTGVGMVSLFLTISPGSFLVDIDWEERWMLVHYIDASNPARLRRHVERYYRLWEYESEPSEGGPDDADRDLGRRFPDA
jgi:multisubunit Na+/H+ antiporter MnhE subunit